MIQVIYSCDSTPFRLSAKAVAWLGQRGYEVTGPVPRHNPLLIQCLRELGREFSAYGVQLCVAQIPGNEYRIEKESDGRERVITPEAEQWVHIDWSEEDSKASEVVWVMQRILGGVSIVKPRRMWEVVWGRYIVIHRLLELGYSTTDAGKAVGLNHSSVSAAKTRIAQMLALPESYKKEYELWLKFRAAMGRTQKPDTDITISK